jgi:cysteinyl-tRNA synthetase
MTTRAGRGISAVSLLVAAFGLTLPASSPAPERTDPRLAAVKDFFYVLQMDKVSLSALANTRFDLLVMDYARFGDEDSEFTPAQIASVKKGGTSGCPKTVLAYMSIGEAENYRFYWDDSWKPGSPAWLGPENPDWEGNFKVRYWMAGWQSLILGTSGGPKKSYLDRIIDQGFDGVYLDIIDAYQYWSDDEGVRERTRIQARRDMAAFVKRIRSYARTRRGKKDFLVVPQNAADIIWDDNGVLDAVGSDYLTSCDGIGQEDLWYNETTPQPADSVRWTLKALKTFRSKGKKVLSIDYIWDPAHVFGSSNVVRFNDYYAKALAQAFVPYAGNKNRALRDIVLVREEKGFLYAQPRVE